MPITCTYGDLDKLRERPGYQGPLSKLLNSTETASVIDRFRIGRLGIAVNAALADYQKMLVELGKKLGDLSIQGGVESYKIRAASQADFVAEKAKIDAETVELAVNPLPLSAYEKVQLSAADLTLLEKFVVLPDGV